MTPPILMPGETITDALERLQRRVATLTKENRNMDTTITSYAVVIFERDQEIERLRERLGPRGLEVVIIDGAGHYVNVKVKAKIERLTMALKRIADQDVDADLKGQADILAGIAYAALTAGKKFTMPEEAERDALDRSGEDSSQDYDENCKVDDCRKQELQGQIDELLEALIWCSASQDFQEGGVAREGWLKLCKPLIDAAINPDPPADHGSTIRKTV